MTHEEALALDRRRAREGWPPLNFAQSVKALAPVHTIVKNFAPAITAQNIPTEPGSESVFQISIKNLGAPRPEPVAPPPPQPRELQQPRYPTPSEPPSSFAQDVVGVIESKLGGRSYSRQRFPKLETDIEPEEDSFAAHLAAAIKRRKLGYAPVYKEPAKA